MRGIGVNKNREHSMFRVQQRTVHLCVSASLFSSCVFSYSISLLFMLLMDCVVN